MKREERLLEKKKYIYNLEKKSKEQIKVDYCLLCGKTISSTCHSHIIPKFILKEISENGLVSFGKTISDDKLLNITKGTKNVFNFRLICNDCDCNFFKEYESIKAIDEFDSFDENRKNRILIKMSIKEHLSSIYMLLTLDRFKAILSPYEYLDHRGYRGDLLGVEQHLNIINQLKESLKENDHFKIIYNNKFDYKMRMACQSCICMVKDLRKNLIYDFKDVTRYNLFHMLYIVIFPYENNTRVILYVENKNVKYYKDFIEDFSSKTEEEKLHIIFIMIILYTEAFCMSPSLKDEIIKDRKIVALFNNSDFSRRNQRVFNHLANFKTINNYLK